MVGEGSSELKLNDEKEPVTGNLGGKLSGFREQQAQTRNKVGVFKDQREALCGWSSLGW